MSYGKAANAVAEGIRREFDTDPDLARWFAHLFLIAAVPERQRKALAR